MDEITCDVYDIFHPSPVSLKELSIIAIRLEIWRGKVIKSRTRSTSEDREFVLPDLPSTICNNIDEITTRFNSSINRWLQNHFKRIFQFHRDHLKSVLEDFDDFAVDFNCNVHYVRTAERMMRCDRISEAEKFKIACTYFFEDDIRRIWPSVCESLDLNVVKFRKSPQVYYWVCRLRNQLNKIPVRRNHSIDEVMFDHCMPDNRPSVEYFWARLPLESQLRKACDLYRDRGSKLVSFARFVLPKLDDQRLVDFVNAEGYQLMIYLLKGGFGYEWLFLPTWMYIKNKMYQSCIKNVVLEMLRFESDAFGDDSKSEPKYWFDFCVTVWNSIPSDWKRSILEDILSDMEFFEDTHRPRVFRSRYRTWTLYPRFMTFLSVIVSCATPEQRSVFWHNCWSYLIRDSQSEDLHRMMKLCLYHEDRMAQFKESNMANSDKLRDVCVKLLKKGRFNHLNDLIDFSHPETLKGMNFKEQLLRSTLHLEVSHYGVVFVEILLTDRFNKIKLKEFNAFIDSAFESVNLSANFKNKLMSSHFIIPMHPSPMFIICFPSDYLNALMELAEIFVISERAAKIAKKRILRLFIDHPCWNRDSLKLDRVLLWCLGSEDKVADFKRCKLVQVHKVHYSACCVLGMLE